MSEFVHWLTGTHQATAEPDIVVAVTDVPTGHVIAGL
jgi:hypothetical protein